MTEKDYIKIADIFRFYRHGLKSEQPLLNAIVYKFIEMFEADNPRFNKQRFIDYINKPEQPTMEAIEELDRLHDLAENG